MLFSLVKKGGSIRFQLIAAFSIVGVMAIASAFYAWISASQTEKKMSSVVSDLLPLVSYSHQLSRNVTSFAIAIGELTNVESATELQAISEKLQQRSTAIQQGLSTFDTYTFETEFIAKLKKKAEQLTDNLDNQKQLTTERLIANQSLHDSIEQLSIWQNTFTEAVTPHISRKNTTPAKKGGEIKIDTPNGKLTIDLRRVSILFLLSGILHEAANVNNIDNITTLQTLYAQTEPSLLNTRVNTKNSTTENARLTIMAAPIIRAGQGSGSIFNLRAKELQLQILSHTSALEAIRLSESLADDVAFLAQASQQYAEDSMKKLSATFFKYRLLTAIIAMATLIISICICFAYVERRIIRRIGLLQKTMDEHAEGFKTPIPTDPFEDEIGSMTRTLKRFVSQREKIAEKLHKTLLSLNEAQQLVRIGNCERDHRAKTWQWSEGFYHIIGYSPEELPSSEENFWKVVYQDDRLQVERFFATLSSTSRTTEIEFRIMAKDGDILTVSGLWKLVDPREPSAFTQHGTIQDITEKKQIAEDLLKIKKMESISVLAGGISHDFNNLLTGIMGNIALVSKLIDQDHPAQEHLKLSEQASHRARDLTNKLLTFSSGGNPIRNVTSLPDLLRETVKRSFTDGDITCRYYIEGPLWLVDMDASHIHQILHNLVANAEYSMPDGGTVTIHCSNQLLEDHSIANLPSGSYVKVIFSDSGAGIPAEHIEQVFDPYYTTKGFHTNKGSGLGLAIVHAVISKHGGVITVESKIDQGTNFILYLPAMPEPSLEPLEKKEDDSAGRIIIMDDEEVVRNMVKRMLLELGYKVHAVADGVTAIKLYDSLSKQGGFVDAIIMDLNTSSGMGGKEAVEHLLKKYPKAKAIVSSGYSTDPVIENFHLYGFCDIIIKPYKLEDLSTVVARVAAMP